MKTAVAHLSAPIAPNAAERLSEDIVRGLDGARADLLVLFASPHFLEELDTLVEELAERIPTQSFIGVTGEAVVAGPNELEGQAAIVVWAAAMPGVRARAFHLMRDDVMRLDRAAAVEEALGVPASSEPNFILFGDPYSFPIGDFLDRLRPTYAGRPAVGGMASAGEAPHQNALIFDGQVLHSGMVGVALTGNLRMDTIVSQGCRPIGRHLVVTQAENNIIRQIGGRKPIEVVNELLAQSSPREIELMKERGLLLGFVINEQQAKFGVGDFLIRNPLGIDQDSGALVINDRIRVGQTIQFHVRDASSASQDLSELLQPAAERPHAGALLFTCNGRGTRLFPRPHHDARTLVSTCHTPAVAGFFCAGEIGPVGGENHVHGFTASIALFSPAH